MRKPMVTRTINSTKATVLCMDLAEGRAYEQDFFLSGIIRDEKKALKSVMGQIPDGHRAVCIKDLQIVKRLYGMSEETFLEHAHLLPPRK